MSLNSGKPWPSLTEARERVLGIQRKLHRWSKEEQLQLALGFPSPTSLVESRMRGNAHVRFGGRSGETELA